MTKIAPKTPEHQLRMLKTFEIIDDLTLHVSTEKPYPFTPNDMSRVAIIDSAFENATTEDFNTGKATFGTGPFTFSKWMPGDLIEIKSCEGKYR